MKLATIVTAASLAIVWTQTAMSDTRSVEPPRGAPATASDMSDADVLADRHLALYRASRTTVMGLREPSDDDGHAVSVRTSATAALPLPSDGQAADSAELSAR